VSWKSIAEEIMWPWLFRLADQVIVPSSGGARVDAVSGPSRRPRYIDALFVDKRLVDSKNLQKLIGRPSELDGGASSADMVILFCAKLQPWKRPLDLLRAFAKAKLSSALLVFAGRKGPLRSQLESEATALGVRLAGPIFGFVNQTQASGRVTSSDLMVLPRNTNPLQLSLRIDVLWMSGSCDRSCGRGR